MCLLPCGWYSFSALECDFKGVFLKEFRIWKSWRLRGPSLGSLWEVSARFRQLIFASSQEQKFMLVSFLGHLFGSLYTLFRAQGRTYLHVGLHAIKSVYCSSVTFSPHFWIMDYSHDCWKSRTFFFFLQWIKLEIFWLKLLKLQNLKEAHNGCSKCALGGVGAR